MDLILLPVDIINLLYNIKYLEDCWSMKLDMMANFRLTQNLWYNNWNSNMKLYHIN
jgi:hypothetical protein